jgi:hypothetical protein
MQALLKKIRAKARDSSEGPGVTAGSHPLAPREFAGKWVAWSADHREIVASGDTLAEVREQVARSGVGGVSYEKLCPLSRGLAPQG